METKNNNNTNSGQQTVDSLGEMIVHLDYIRKDLSDIKDELKDLRNQYVTQIEFAPVKKLVFGLVGIVLVAVIGAITALVIK